MTLVLIITLIALALLGLPLFIVLGAGALYACWATGLDSATLIIELYRLANSPNLGAIPLFTFAGVVLAAGGAPQRLIRLFSALFGWLPGGLAIMTLTACAFFTAFSGASGVTILALGGLLYPMLTRVGYPQPFSLGLLTASGSIGLLFPPSLPMLLYSIVAGINVDQLFKAGMLPGGLLLLILALYSMKMAPPAVEPRPAFSWMLLVEALRAGVWDLLLPMMVMVGIYGGFITVNEAATITAAYVLILESVIHPTLNLKKDLLPLTRDASVLVGGILIILGSAMGLTNLLIDAQLPMKLLELFESNIHSQLSFLLFLNLFLLLVGFLMDIFSATMVVVPLILPIARHFGVDPVQLGIIFMANLEIGYLHPPVGMNLFFASQRFKVPIWHIFMAVLPFLAIMLVWLAIVTYVPWISLWQRPG